MNAIERFTLFYDGHCPLCRREVRVMRQRDRQDKLAYVDIAAPDFRAADYALDAQAVHARIHGIERDGRVLTGMNVLRRAYQLLGYGWLVSWTGWPIVRPVTDAMYRAFARNRHWLTGRKDCPIDACKM